MAKRSAFLPDHTAWLAVFIPAVAYLIATRIWLFPNNNGASSSAPLLDEGSSIFSRSYIRVTSNRLYLPSLSEVTTNNNTRARTNDLQSLFYVTSSSMAVEAEASSSDLELYLGMKPGVQLVLEGKPLREIQSLVWRHDEELGRGYLLLSDSFGSGRIWRWEVGGGPICIGRSLHMDQSGCRSRVNCMVGSGGMAIDPPSSSLVVAEWGQERIIRLESETGSRTPLVWTVPDSSSSSTTTAHNTNPVTRQQQQRRLHRPNHLLYTPFGDLLFVDHERAETNEDPTAVGMPGIYRLREAVHVPPLPPHKSREAHDWTKMPTLSAAMTTAPAATELLFQEHVQQIGGLALDANLTGIYVSAIVPTIRDDQEQHQRHVLLHIPLQEDDDEIEKDDSSDDDDEDSQKEDTGAKKEVKEDNNEKESDPSMDIIRKGLLDGTAREVMDLTPLHEKVSHGKGSRIFVAGPLTVDEKGHVFVVVGGSLVVLSPSGSSVLGMIPLGLNEGDSVVITDVVLGEDGFLYVSTLHQLLRLRTKAKPMSVPTNLIPPQRTQGFTWD